MITYLHLTNFKTHRDLEINFGSGLQLLKGANEAGKSSVIQALVYALFGVRATGFSIADLVTWGQPENSLRVELKLAVGGREYLLYRTKSSCELASGTLLVSGQSEVTKFVESLLQVSADLAAKLLLANQNDLRGAIAAGPSGAVQLIEKLADFSLFETVVERIQSRLVSGNTSNVEAQIAQDESIAKPEEPDWEQQSLGVVSLARREAAEAARLKELEGSLAELDTTLAKSCVDDSNKKSEALTAAQTQAWQLGETLKTLKLQPYSGLTLEEISQRMAAQAQASTVERARRTFEGIETSLREGVADFEHLPDSKAAVEAQLKEAQARIEGWVGRLKALDAELPKLSVEARGECRWCLKDLSSIPEVQELGQRRLQLIEDQKILAHEISAEQANEAACLTALEFVRELHARAERYSEFISVEDSWPPTFSWIGPATWGEDNTDYKALMRKAQEAQKAYDEQEGKRATLQEGIRQANALANRLARELENIPLKDAKDTLQLAASLEGQLKVLRESVRSLETERRNEDHRLASLRTEYKFASQRWEEAQARAGAAKQQLADMRLHNSVIKRLREARPEVAKRLWSTVMASISLYFSQIRGVQSVVLKTDSGFLVDGHPAAGLSGSTLDSLGMAIRLALLKTFLPNLDFFVIDEPASGMDDSREVSMLGLLGTCGMNQVIMVTHSELADSFAQEIIQL